VTHSLLSRRAAVAGAFVLFGLQSALAETPTTQEIVHATATGS